MRRKDIVGRKMWKYLVTPASSENITNTMNDMKDENGEININGYKYEIKLLEIIFKYSNLTDKSFKDFKKTLLESTNLENKKLFINNWVNITKMINDFHMEQNEIDEIDELNELDELDEDDLLSGEPTQHINKLQKLIEYLNSDKFKSVQDFTILFNHLKILKEDNTGSIKFIEKMKLLSAFENTINNPESMFGIRPTVIDELDVSIFQKWFDENSSLFNEYLYMANNTINKLGSCPNIKYCNKSNEESKCNIYPPALKPNDPMYLDELTGKADALKEV